MFTKAFWLATLERAVKTAAQSMLALVGVATAATVTTLQGNWLLDAKIAGVAAGLSVLTSIVSAGVGKPGPSLATEITSNEPDAGHAVDSQTAGYLPAPGDD